MYSLSSIPEGRGKQPNGLYQLYTATGGNRTRDHLDQDSATWLRQYLSVCLAAGVTLRSLREKNVSSRAFEIVHFEIARTLA